MQLKNYACLIEYNGKDFFGFQKQPNKRSIQEELEKAINKFTNDQVTVVCAGRTDAKVHAFAQVINFNTTSSRNTYNYIKAINSFLPNDIIIHDCQMVPLDFNARFNAINRTYKYYLYTTKFYPAIFNNLVGFFHKELDINLMQQACNMLLGTQDFSCFRASDCQAKNPIKTISQAILQEIKPNLLCFTFTANSFLYHMIRNIIGSLIYVGIHKFKLNDFYELLNSKNRTLAAPTFMPDGLYLNHITYDPNILQFNIPNNNFFEFI